MRSSITADEILTAFRRDIEKLLTCGRFPAIATHDAEAIVHSRDWLGRQGVLSQNSSFR
jgi:hypothetical protein